MYESQWMAFTNLPALCCFQHRFFQRTFHETQLEQSNFLPVRLFRYSQSLLKVPEGERGRQEDGLLLSSPLFILTHSYHLLTRVGKKERINASRSNLRRPHLLRFSISASFCSLISCFWWLNSVFRRSMSSTRDERARSCSFSSARNMKLKGNFW